MLKLILSSFKQSDFQEGLHLYNKKELQEELGQYDYGARFYDPVIADGHHYTNVINGEKINPDNYTGNEHIGAVGTHEATHTTDKNSNRVQNPHGTTNQLETLPYKNELEYFHQIDKKKQPDPKQQQQ